MIYRIWILSNFQKIIFVSLQRFVLANGNEFSMTDEIMMNYDYDEIAINCGDIQVIMMI